MSSSVVRAAAPGRVNLIGEHTDYNGGFVLPTAIPQQTRVELTRRQDQRVAARSTNDQLPGDYVLGHGRAVGERIARTYAERSGRTPTLLVPPEPTASG